jgi:hypothetical protein
LFLFSNWPSENQLIDRSDIEILKVLHAPLIEVCLRVLSTLKVEPNPDKVFIRVCTNLQFLPLTAIEWAPLLSNKGFLSVEVKVRILCLQAVLIISDRAQKIEIPPDSIIIPLIWLLKFDKVDSVSELANKVWIQNQFTLASSFFDYLQSIMNHEFEHVRNSVAHAIAGGIKELNTISQTDMIISKLKEIYFKNTHGVIENCKYYIFP